MKASRRSTSLLSGAVALLVGAVVQSGCSVESDPVKNGCNSLADCSLEQVCDAVVGECIDTPLNRLIGFFECDLVEAGAQSPLVLGSEVTGLWEDQLDGVPQRVVFTSGSCFRIDGQIGVNLSDLFGRYSVSLLLEEGVEVSDVRAPFAPFELNTATLQDRDRDHVAAYSGDGLAQLRQAPEPLTASHLQGYVDLALVATPREEVVFGVGCSEGVVDCGRDGSGSVICSPGIEMCTTTCFTDERCDALDRGTVCWRASDDGQGFCFLPCDNASECPDGFVCEADLDGRRGCTSFVLE